MVSLGMRLFVFVVDFDETVTGPVCSLIHERIVRFVKDHFVVDGEGPLLLLSKTVVITGVERV
jgi:hypothetical protein